MAGVLFVAFQLSPASSQQPAGKNPAAPPRTVPASPDESELFLERVVQQPAKPAAKPATNLAEKVGPTYGCPT
jgi:hypothetical protein